MESLPPDALLVAIVDENLAGALPGVAGHGVVSGSHAVHDARRRLAPRTEVRTAAADLSPPPHIYVYRAKPRALYTEEGASIEAATIEAATP